MTRFSGNWVGVMYHCRIIYVYAKTVEFSGESDQEVYTVKRLKLKLQQHNGEGVFLQKLRDMKMLSSLETWLIN